MKKIRVLICAYEVTPFYKRGGLGDVMGSLPIALEAAGVNIRVVMPYYKQIKKRFPQKRIGGFLINFDGQPKIVGIYKGRLPGSEVPIYFLENRRNINLVNLKAKKIEHFVFFDLAVSQLIGWLEKHEHWNVSLLHCNDWHTALIPLILETKIQHHIPTLLTIHNLAYQGKGSTRILDLLEIQDSDVMELRRGESANELNALGEGILHATKVSTVSPTYAKEIMVSQEDSYINRCIARREKELGKDGSIIGILNGIEYPVWNPEQDRWLHYQYNITNAMENKRKNKALLLKHLELEDRPTCIFIGRMVIQKGLDIITKSIEKMVKMNINIVLLGIGHPAIEASVEKLQKKYPSHVRSQIFYNEEYAHKLYASADFFLIPSHYEPCGLVQMIAMHYGALPIASRTGGLKDTIEEGKNGFLFTNGSSKEFVQAIKRAIQIYMDPESLHKMVGNAMSMDFSWDKSAKLYKDLYEDMLH